MILILQLPSEVLGEIVSRWLDTKSFVRLDSAVCNAENRPVLHELFASKHCGYTGAIRISNKPEVNWFSKRQIKMLHLVLVDIFPHVTKYLQLYSPSIQCASCHSNSAVDTVAFYCRHLKTLNCNSYIKLGANLGAALWSNTGLRNLHLDNIDGLKAELFENIRLPQLQQLSLRDSVCNDDCLGAIVRTTENLQALDVTRTHLITDAGIIAVAQQCPLLHTFAASGLAISNGALDQLTTLCPRIAHFDISNSKFVSNNGIRAIAHNLKALISIDISYCRYITDIALLYLAKDCAETLTSLRMNQMKLVRVGVLADMLRRCIRLRAFSFSFDLSTHCTVIVPHMCRLSTILASTILSEEVLLLVAQHCVHLKKLGIFPAHYSPSLPNEDSEIPIDSFFSEELQAASIADLRALSTGIPRSTSNLSDASVPTAGLLALMDGLPQLKLLGMSRMPSRLAMCLLQRLCPSWQLTDKIADFQKDFLLA